MARETRRPRAAVSSRARRSRRRSAGGGPARASSTTSAGSTTSASTGPSSQLYTLSDKSKDVLGRLDRDVEVDRLPDPASQLYVPVDRAARALRGGVEPRSRCARRRRQEPGRGQARWSTSTASRPHNVVFRRRRGRAPRDRAGRSRRLRLLGHADGPGAADAASSRASRCSPAPSSSWSRAGSPRCCSPPATARLARRRRRRAGCRRRRTSSAATTSRSRAGARSARRQVPAGTDLVVVAGPQALSSSPSSRC